MMETKTRLKAYSWSAYDDCDDGFLCVIAESSKEAKKIGYKYWSSEYGFDGDYIDIRVKLLKEVNIDGLFKGVVEDLDDGLKRGLMGYVEGECPRCGYDSRYEWDNGFFCYNCEGQELCPKCSAWTLDSTTKKCSECDKEVQ